MEVVVAGICIGMHLCEASEAGCLHIILGKSLLTTLFYDKEQEAWHEGYSWLSA